MHSHSLSIFGFGAFGRFASSHLHTHFDMVTCDAMDRTAEAASANVTYTSLSDAAHADIIVLAIPVQRMEPLLRQLAPLLAKRTPLVIDVASVKVKPIALMRDLLPPETEIIGTHPLFGPQSGKNGIEGLPIAFCPVRASQERIACVRSFLGDTLKLRVLDVSPEEHDRQMAYVQGLTHLVARASAALNLPRTELATLAYRRFAEMSESLTGDSWELFKTIENENPFAAEVRRRFAENIAEIEKQLRHP
ncbi:MAG: prephenate dehydrogenase [Phycisphaeraceae bacterium]|nr:prephenate dehydrogenase [Phycisphaeraceae bacterium]